MYQSLTHTHWAIVPSHKHKHTLTYMYTLSLLTPSLLHMYVHMHLYQSLTTPTEPSYPPTNTSTHSPTHPHTLTPLLLHMYVNHSLTPTDHRTLPHMHTCYMLYSWYVVNYSLADELLWGCGKGCSFAADSCLKYITDQKNRWAWFLGFGSHVFRIYVRREGNFHIIFVGRTIFHPVM